jgi:hypothetical protein
MQRPNPGRCQFLLALQSALPLAGSGFVYRGCIRGRDKALIYCREFGAPRKTMPVESAR